MSELADTAVEDESSPHRILRKIMFFIELPEPVLIPHGDVYTQTFDVWVPELEGAWMQFVDTKPHTGYESEGWLYASIRVWQAHLPAQALFSPAVEGVMQAVLPPSVYGQSNPTMSGAKAVKTVIDASTLLLPEDGDDAVRVAFNRCLIVIRRIIRGFELADRKAITPISFERMPWVIPFVTCSVDDPPQWDAQPSFLMLHGNPPELVLEEAPEFAEEHRDRLYVTMDRLGKGDPVPTLLEAQLRADRVLRREGDYQTAIILTYLAAEVLLDTVLTLLLWEEGMPPETAATTVFSVRTARRVKTHFKDRLGGLWDTEGSGEVARWARTLGGVRHRIVHTGYWPTREEAYEGMDILHNLDQYVRDRLIARRNTYPRSTLLLIGQPGLERRGHWTKRMQRFVQQSAGEPDWVESYAEWRRAFDAARLE